MDKWTNAKLATVAKQTDTETDQECRGERKVGNT